MKHEAFWRTIALDQKVVGYHPNSLLRMRGVNRRLGSTGDGIPPCNVQEEERLINALDKQTRETGAFLFNRRFLTTPRGYIGLVPPDVEKGDMICVLLGGEVPYVLRPRERGGYTMIGEW